MLKVADELKPKPTMFNPPLLHLRKLGHDGCHIVLCNWRGEWVTWVENVLGKYVLGHYFQEYNDAFADYLARH